MVQILPPLLERGCKTGPFVVLVGDAPKTRYPFWYPGSVVGRGEQPRLRELGRVGVRRPRGVQAIDTRHRGNSFCTLLARATVRGAWQPGAMGKGPKLVNAVALKGDRS